MAKVQGMAQFVNRSFAQPLAEPGVVALESVKFLAQTRKGDDGAPTS
jgi:hypothetical protein